MGMTNNCNKGYAFVRFEDENVIEEILKGTHYLDNRKVETKVSYGVEHNLKDKVESAKCKIFVKKISKEVCNDELHNHFLQFGKIKTAYIIKDHHTNESKGFGYVQFISEQDVENVLQTKHFLK